MRAGDRVVVLAHARAFPGMHGVVRMVAGRSPRAHGIFVILDGDTWPSLLFADELVPEEAATEPNGRG